MSVAFLRAVDIFDKFNDDDLRVRTKSGAFLSMLLALFAGLFFAIKTLRFFSPKIFRDLALTPSVVNQQDFVNISVSVIVDLPCYFLHLDAIDSLGFSQFDINSTANLRRLTSLGKFIGIAKQTLKRLCHPCFGILPDNVCCNSCEQLVLMFLFKGLIPHPEHWPQCRSQNAPPQVSLDEKCLIKGKISVNKVSGQFHIAPGRNDLEPGQVEHHHDLSFTFPNLDMSHKIERIRFGPDIPTAHTPLTGLSMRHHGNGPMEYHYHLMATPLVHIYNGKERARGYEYTTMITQAHISPGMAPGIFFDYRFTPYGVVVNAVSRSFGQYLTSTFGFLSGAFAAVTLLDTFLQNTGFASKIEKSASEKKDPPETKGQPEK
jgi:hypothetical protein